MGDFENLEDQKKYAQSVVDHISFIEDGLKLNPDFAAGAVLGVFVDLVVYVMTYKAKQNARESAVYNRLVLALYDSVENKQKAVDPSRANKELNDLATFILSNTPSSDKKVLQAIVAEFYLIREMTLVENPSIGNCDKCGQPQTNCQCDGDMELDRCTKALIMYSETVKFLRGKGLSLPDKKDFMRKKGCPELG